MPGHCFVQAHDWETAKRRSGVVVGGGPTLVFCRSLSLFWRWLDPAARFMLFGSVPKCQPEICMHARRFKDRFSLRTGRISMWRSCFTNCTGGAPVPPRNGARSAGTNLPFVGWIAMCLLVGVAAPAPRAQAAGAARASAANPREQVIDLKTAEGSYDGPTRIFAAPVVLN